MKFIKTFAGAMLGAATIQKFYIEKPEGDDEYYRLRAQASDGTNTIDLYDTEEEAQAAMEELARSLHSVRFINVGREIINVANIVEVKVIPACEIRAGHYEVRVYYLGAGNDYYRPEGLKLQAATLGIFNTAELANKFLAELAEQLSD